MTIAERIALPRYNVTDHKSPAQFGPQVAAGLALTLWGRGIRSAYTSEHRRPTEEEQAAYRQDRLDNYGIPRNARDIHARVIIVQVRGPVEEVFEDAGFDPVIAANKRLVQAFLGRLDGARQRKERAARHAAHDAAVDAFLAGYAASPALERHIRAACAFDARGARQPEATDLTDWIKRAIAKTSDQFHKPLPAYAPKPSGFRLLTDKAVKLTYVQDSYADYVTTAIPLEVTQPTDVAAARENLAQLSRRLDTHTGWAGSGTDYTFDLHAGDEGAYVILTARHSIAD